MYKLTPYMEQKVRDTLKKYHDLFDGGRCQGWELEEIITKVIRSDTKASHHAKWREAGHDDKEDILVVVNGSTHHLQIKSGKLNSEKIPTHIALSGYRLGRFNGNLTEISDYLNSMSSQIIAVPYKKVDDNSGRHHIYRFCYIDPNILAGITSIQWKQKGKQFQATNSQGVELSLHPSMSWQVWWKIPLAVTYLGDEFTC